MFKMKIVNNLERIKQISNIINVNSKFNLITINHKHNFHRNNKIKYTKSNFYKYPMKFRADYDPSKDYYKILGISQSADDKDIKQAYYKLAKQYHPDLNKGQTTDKFKEINSAYEVLSDPSKRLQYDASRKMNSFFGGKTYSDQQRTQTGSSSYSNNNYSYNTQWNKTNYDFRQDPFFKNFSDWFKNSQSYNTNKSKDNYKSNFSSGEKKDNFKNYYQKNKDYFSTFKESSGTEDNKKTTKGTKKENLFGKDYYEKNKKYYESFKIKKDREDEGQSGSYNYHSDHSRDEFTRRPADDKTNSVLFLIYSIFGVIIGSILVNMFFHGNNNQRRQYQKDVNSQQIQPVVRKNLESVNYYPLNDPNSIGNYNQQQYSSQGSDSFSMNNGGFGNNSSYSGMMPQYGNGKFIHSKNPNIEETTNVNHSQDPYYKSTKY